MKILIAPLNWGLGHATRCVPLVEKWIQEGNKVVLAGDGESFIFLTKYFPHLRHIHFSPLNLRYSQSNNQVWAILRAIPHIFLWAIKDHILLRSLLKEESFDLIVSDNRFGFYSPRVQSVYITHQLQIRLPNGWRWAERIATSIHARVYAKYNKVWVPDIDCTDSNLIDTLAGELSHLRVEQLKKGLSTKFNYIGPLSRFNKRMCTTQQPHEIYHTVCVLSGLEPQRTLFEQQLLARYKDCEQRVLIVRGMMGLPNTRITHRNITIVPSLDTQTLAQALCSAQHIVARAGYSTIMDLAALDLLDKAELIPTPGQPEQEYLSEHTRKRYGKP